MIDIDPSEITPEPVYLYRRQFMMAAGALLLSTAVGACSGPQKTSTPEPLATSSEPTSAPAPLPTLLQATTPTASRQADELGGELTKYESVVGYTNYYEFSLSKEGPAALSADFKISPWRVQIGGLVHKPSVYTLDDLLRFAQEERIYRMRCVEGWSMVIPWIGFPLSQLLEQVEPTSEAQFVRFETVYAPEQMPGQRGRGFEWPYVEGLRLDEALHPLTILATGLYGKPLAKQNGAPVRLVVPWKYGFKSIKSIVKIDLVAEMPTTFWMASAPQEYGFYANVNPDVPHPRWSQATERRIGEFGRRETLLFNGYDEVAPLYADMDLRRFY
ncbi:MAG: protein-methionine-sulfoxide reductase catalytic subunit MsrP [Chloroflexi bacterium]|nr:protein-methionine-sulfoxide reductase catalytic subunit MsrP [Chloroflexota bacterium]